MATSPVSASTVVLDHALYDEDCLTAACEAYKAFVVIAVERSATQSRITLTPAPGAPRNVHRELLNYMLDLSIKKRLGS